MIKISAEQDAQLTQKVAAMNPAQRDARIADLLNDNSPEGEAEFAKLVFGPQAEIVEG